LSISPGRLLGRGRFGPAGSRGASGAGARPDAGGGGPERLVPGGAVGRGAGGGAAVRCPTGRARHARARGSRLPRESDEPLLLLQDGVVAPAVSRGARSWPRRRVRRYERGRPARASPGLCRGAGGGRALAAGRNGAHPGGRAASRARASAPGVGRPGGAVSLEPRGLWHPDYVTPPGAGGAGRDVSARAGGDGGSAGPSPRGSEGRAYRSRAALDSLGDSPLAGGAGALGGSRVRGGRAGSSRLSPRRSPRRADSARVRLFVALNLPETVRTSLSACVRPLQSMGFALRWMTPAQVQLTLNFLGDAEPERAAELIAALGRACTGARPVTLSLGGFCVFPHY